MNVSKNIVIFNGPPGSGKDECAMYSVMLSKEPAVHMEQKNKLFDIALSISNISHRDWFNRYSDRELKDTPWDRLPANPESLGWKGAGPVDGGVDLVQEPVHYTQRQYLIWVSETVVKPVHGRDYFGQCSKKLIEENDSVNFYFSDGGFIAETLPLLEAGRVTIIRIHREGYTYSGDSRAYLYLDRPDVTEIDIYNDGTLQDLLKKVKDLCV